MGQVLGTPEYIAPEVILRQGYGKPVDWWSLGIILYEFLIGCVPFFGETPEELFAHTVGGEVEWPGPDDWEVSSEARDLVIRLLQHDPADRLGTAGAAAVKEHAWFSLTPPLDWGGLLRVKAEFIPQLQGEEDTRYFDTREGQYPAPQSRQEAEDVKESTSLYRSFSSCSPRYQRDNQPANQPEDSLDEVDSSGCSSAGSPHLAPRPANPESPELRPAQGKDTQPEAVVATSSSLLNLATRLEESFTACTEQEENVRLSLSLEEAEAVQGLYELEIDRCPSQRSSGGPAAAGSRQAELTRAQQAGGLGFSLRAIRVYYGDTDYCTVHHLLAEVEPGSGAARAGIRQGLLLTHVNHFAVQNF